jgi:hexosaminidase
VAFLQDQASWIFLPASVTVEISTDGKKFETVRQESIQITPDGKKSLRTILVQLDAPRPARYVRIRAVNLKKCPAWHPGNGNPCWIFADEIIAE